MENSRSKIFSEIKESLDLLKKEVSVLEDRLTILESLPEDQQPDELPIAEAPVFVSEPLDDSEQLTVKYDDMSSFFTESEPGETVEPEPEAASASEKMPTELSFFDDEEVVLDNPDVKVEAESEPSYVDGPVRKEETVNDIEASSVKLSIADSLREKRAWRVDRPGAPVRNILSAISLNDRVLFIHTLFTSDPILFQNTVNKLNNMQNFNDAESYLLENFKEWDFNSEVVYRFMMAVRRKQS